MLHTIPRTPPHRLLLKRPVSFKNYYLCLLWPEARKRKELATSLAGCVGVVGRHWRRRLLRIEEKCNDERKKLLWEELETMKRQKFNISGKKKRMMCTRKEAWKKKETTDENVENFQIVKKKYRWGCCSIKSVTMQSDTWNVVTKTSNPPHNDLLLQFQNNGSSSCFTPDGVICHCVLTLLVKFLAGCPDISDNVYYNYQTTNLQGKVELTASEWWICFCPHVKCPLLNKMCVHVSLYNAPVLGKKPVKYMSLRVKYICRWRQSNLLT